MIGLCGFALVDLVDPGSGWVGIYWLTLGPIGTGLSWWLAARAGQRAGQADRRTGQRWAGHFVGFFAVGYLLTLYLPEYGFTTAGALVAAALVTQAILGRSPQNAAN